VTTTARESVAAAFKRYRPLRFALVGAVNTVFSYAVYAFFVFVGAGLGWASFISLTLGIAFGFMTHGTIVFRGLGGWAFVKFVAVWAVLYQVFVGVVLLAERVGINNYAGGAIAVPVVACLSYFLQSRYVFTGEVDAGVDD